jgi:phage terminase small subunit
MSNKPTELTPRQSAFLRAYTAPDSTSFGNAYQSARAAGYTEQTSKNITHLQPGWLSENIGQIASVIEPEQIMQKLTSIINDIGEPTIVKLKAIEMTMKAYSMLVQRREQKTETVTLNIDLSGTSGERS